MSEAPPTLTEVRAQLSLLSQSLPSGVDPLSMKIGSGDITRSKTPTIALCYRESQAWRFEEFTRTSCDLFDRDDIVASVACTRHAAECCAGVWYLLEQIERAIADAQDPTDLHGQMVRLFVGSKLDQNGNVPQAINVLTFLKRLDRRIPGFFNTYERLSEVAHPNWAGSAAIFSKLDPQTLITHFAKNLRDIDYVRNLNLRCLMGSLEIFSYAYNRITDLMPDFCEACEQAIIRREKAC